MIKILSSFKFILLVFIVWRLVLFLPLVTGEILLPYREGQEFTNILGKLEGNSFLNNPLIYPWSNFDGVHYLSIAGNGYTTDGRFFPLFPILINFLSELLGDKSAYSGIQFISGLILANLFFFLALIIFYKLVKKEYSEKNAKIAIISMLIFPTSFFFGSIYSESLFLMLSLMVFYFADKGNFALSGLTGMLLTSTRLVGISIFPSALFDFFRQKKNRVLSLNSLIGFFWVLLIPLGLLSFSVYSYYKWGELLNFLYAHGSQGNSRALDTVIFPIQTVFRYFKIFTLTSIAEFEWWIALLELVFFIFVICLIVTSWKKKVKASYIIYSLFAFLIPVFSGTFSGLPRYAAVLFPIYISLSLIEKKWFKISYFTFSPILLFLLLMFFSRGYYIS